MQTYFRTKDELLVFAAHYVGEMLRARVAASLETCDPDDARRRLLLSLEVLTWSDDDSRTEARIWLAFLARAAVHPALREVHVTGSREIRDRCQETLRLAQHLGHVSAKRDAEAEAIALVAFADGLAVQRALEPESMTGDLVRRLLRHYLDQLFEHPDHQGE